MNLRRVVLRCSLLLGSSLFALLPNPANAQVRSRVVEAVNDAKRVTLPGNMIPLARAEYDRGAVGDAAPMKRILLLLKRSDQQEAALQALLQAQQDKSSPNFHQWLTPEQFGTQFGVADSDIQAATDWLSQQGFSVDKVYSSRMVIEFSGNAGQVQRTFGTAIHNYQANGRMYSANASDPQIPAALAPVVAGVVSLNSYPRQYYSRRLGTLHRSGAKTTMEVADPSVTVWYQNLYGVGPGDFAKIYGTPATCGTPAVACNGAGQTIAIVGETNLTVSDVQDFRSIFGLPANFDANSIVYNGEDPGITSRDEEAEALLDSEWSGAVAPGATVKFVLSASTAASQGVDLSALYIVEHNLAAVMSESYGGCESAVGTTENQFVNNLWEQASAQGITVAISTGDSGSAGCDNPNTEGLATLGPAVNGLASTAYNVAVGGTDFDEYGKASTYWSNTNDSTTGTSALGYIPEIPWNQSCAQIVNGCNINTTPQLLQNIVAGGGGTSALHNRPSWQTGVSGTLSSDGKRDVPDVSLFASPGFNGSGYLYCQSYYSWSSCLVTSGFGSTLNFGVIGGTSAAAPAFAGVMALVNQSQATAQNPTPRQGNANYILYALANKQGASCASASPVGAGCVFNDIVAGSSAVPSGGTGIGTIDVPCKYPTSSCSATASSIVGILKSPTSSSTMAWNVASGYDMASGLGSMNIGNLIAAWGTVSTVPTSTTLALSPTTGITHGSENVSATISVTPSSGTAKGTVSLLAKMADGSTFGAAQFTLGANGTATGTVKNLPGGTNYQVYAHYSGDGTNAPSDSTPVSVTVAQESSKTFIVIPTYDPNTGNVTTGNATTINYGTPYIVRMYVTNSSGVASPSGAPTGACTQSSSVDCPTGTVSLTADGNPVDAGLYSLDGIGYTRDLSPIFGTGAHMLSASYSGDTSYLPSSTSETITVNKASTTLVGPDFSPGLLVGVPAGIKADITTQVSAGVPPTGTVTFYDGGTPLNGTLTMFPNPPSSVGNAHTVAVLTTTFTTPGTHVLTASYGGDTNYSASAGQSTSDPVYYATAMAVSSSSTNIIFGQSITLTAVVTSQAKSPGITGQVQFTGGGTFSDVITTPGTDANGNQMLTVTATTVPSGPSSYDATYEGDSNYELANSNSVRVNVTIPDFTLGPPNGLSLVPTAGQSGSVQITVTPGSQIPSTVALSFGQVSIAGYTLSLSPAQVQLNGSATSATLSLVPVGGSTSNAMNLRRKSWHVQLPELPPGSRWTLGFSTIIVAALALLIPGRRRRLRAASGLAFVCFFSVVLGCGGGGGSSNSGGGGGSAQTQSSVTLTTSNSKVSLNDSLTITATVTGGPTFSGTVTLYDYGVQIAALPVDFAQPVAHFTNLNLGVHQLTAKFSGDAKDTSSVSTTLTQTVTGTFSIQIQGQTGDLSHFITAQVGIQ
ncbi:MAG TPA: Ig-like domain repeat protein [Candidatus Eisenbacteria bacterium]|nr:Ig-like domain repeat protein [Candidatus Eisenbacteria bacterium]